MDQPTWNTVYTTDYSRLRVDTSGVYAPELELVDEVNDGITTYRLYTICCDRCKVVQPDGVTGKGYLVPFNYESASWPHSIAAYEEWFVKYLDDVATSSGMSRDALVSGLCSADPVKISGAYEAIAGHFGKHEFDQYPITLTEEELETRWN